MSAALLVCPPLGVYLAWRVARWRRPARILGTVVAGLMVFSFAVAPPNPSATSSTAVRPAEVQAAEAGTSVKALDSREPTAVAEPGGY